MTNSDKSRPWWKNEQGMALVMVLGVLATCMLLIVHMMTVSEILGREAMAAVRKSEQRYLAESAADYSFWMHLTDRRLFSDRSLGQSEEDEQRDSLDFPPWMMDQRAHEFDNGTVVSYLMSGQEGFDYANPSSLSASLDSSDDSDYLADIEDFTDVLTDYQDEDDLRELDGMEADDYADAGFPTLPRNGKPQFRAELYWLRNWANVIPNEIAIIPPRGVSMSNGQSGNGVSSKPSFFSASEDLIWWTLRNEDESDVEQILAARLLWLQEGTPLNDSLDEVLYSKVSNAFSFTEGKVMAICVTATDDSREFWTVFRMTRLVDSTDRNFFADKNRQTLSIWERTIE